MKQLKHDECYLLDSTNTIFFDVDDTLIMWGKKHQKDRTDVINIPDPYIRGHVMNFTPHRTHINILKRNFFQGRQVVVWSAAGATWAKTVVEKLELEEYVTLILEKPSKYVDDKAMDVWYPQRVYLTKDIEGEPLE